MWEWLCYDDGGKGDLWKRWYCEVDDDVKGKHDNTIDFLEVNEAVEWRMPHSRKLNKGLVEIRIRGKVQHRLLGYFKQGRKFVFLLSCTHKQNVYSPKDALGTAERRMKMIEDGDASAIICERPEKADCPL